MSLSRNALRLHALIGERPGTTMSLESGSDVVEFQTVRNSYGDARLLANTATQSGISVIEEIAAELELVQVARREHDGKHQFTFDLI